jgi:hypothetical protein
MKQPFHIKSAKAEEEGKQGIIPRHAGSILHLDHSNKTLKNIGETLKINIMEFGRKSIII